MVTEGLLSRMFVETTMRTFSIFIGALLCSLVLPLRDTLCFSTPDPTHFRLLLTTDSNAGGRHLDVWTVLPQANDPKHPNLAFINAKVYIDGIALPVNDGTGGQVNFKDGHVPDSVTILVVQGKDSALFRLPIPHSMMELRPVVHRSSIATYINIIQRQLGPSDEADVFFSIPPDDKNPHLPARLKATRHSVELAPSRGTPGDIHSEFYAVPAKLDTGSYLLQITVDNGITAISPFRSSVKKERQPVFESVAITHTEKTITLVDP